MITMKIRSREWIETHLRGISKENKNSFELAADGYKYGFIIDKDEIWWSYCGQTMKFYKFDYETGTKYLSNVWYGLTLEGFHYETDGGRADAVYDGVAIPEDFIEPPLVDKLNLLLEN